MRTWMIVYFFVGEADRSRLYGHVTEVRAIPTNTCSVWSFNEVTPWRLAFLEHSSWGPGFAGLVQDSDLLSFVQRCQVYVST